MPRTTLYISSQVQHAAGTPNFTNPNNIIGPNDAALMTATINNGQTSQKLRLGVTIPPEMIGTRFHGAFLTLGSYTSPGFTTQSGGLSFRPFKVGNSEVGTAVTRALDPANGNGFVAETSTDGYSWNIATTDIDFCENFGGFTLLGFVTVGSGYNFSLDSLGIDVLHSATPLECVNTEVVSMATVAGLAASGNTAWTNPTNAQGAPDGVNFATANTSNDGVVGEMDTQELAGSITPGTLASFNISDPRQIRIHVYGVRFSDIDAFGLTTVEPVEAFAKLRCIFRDSSDVDLGIAVLEEDIGPILIGFSNRRNYTFTVQEPNDLAVLLAALDAGGKICIQGLITITANQALGPCNVGCSIDSFQLEVGWGEPAPVGGGGGFMASLAINDEDFLEQLEKDRRK